ncbi:hypothetical protein CXG81DRAFT_8776 [Caulochytrium protostelioides]|uniref:Ceramide very long chain fatty acid hydroxylase n=1 Tax=Caulochytrium protostelioides TaxID=1555241 RepID=A0A4P9XEV5_9FUNG|nr:hypothetical protein CXG81DRAFT_8776 [Caulochytrium protostelioides]|eukprot:RKP04097.1 hypothetical protein CXG81DRAFT_8776 [Caulochytrium protostelioides]
MSTGAAVAVATPRLYTRAEVESHSNASSCWIILSGKVYDITPFLFDHPGGEEILIQFGGQDVTEVMRDEAEHVHSESAYEMLAQYYLGDVADAVVALAAEADAAAADADADADGIRRRDFIDPTKPMLAQVWYSSWSKAHYLEQVHIPRHVHGSAPIFSYPQLEFLSLTPWYVVPVFWLPVIAMNILWSLESFAPWAVATMLALGIVHWTFLEYFLHRFVFHVDHYLPDKTWALTLHFLLHGIHHFLPMDGMRLVMPPALGTALTLAVYRTYMLVVPPAFGPPLLAGSLLGYVGYDMIHYYLHHGRPMTQHIRTMKTYHLDHHYKNADLGFGITSKLWDVVFRTLLL